MAIKLETRIAVLCGGLSSEREVSLRSGKNCLAALIRLGYSKAILIDMGHDIAQQLTTQGIEFAFLALHGKYGEDGCIQGLLEILNIPYTGNGVMASALTMDKDVTKRLLKEAGLPVIPSVTLYKTGDRPSQLQQLETLHFPVMVKPNSEGSSIGMSKVSSLAEVDQALDEAFGYANKVLVEEFIAGESITVGVILKEGQHVTTPILAFRTKTDWYDLEAKYTAGMTEFILPAPFSDSLTHAIQETTLKAHNIAGCYGVSRIDFVVLDQDRYYILEINTIPGMTDLSDLPAQAAAMGIGYDELVQLILRSGDTTR
jgi:D-alanine-D-alanine ligase